jgi:hypothetical protein
MLTVNLPSLLAPGNLPALATSRAVEHVIHTTKADAAIIAAHSTYRRLSAEIPCRIEVLPDAPSGADYFVNIDRMNGIHRRILEECATTGAAWLFDQPDHVWGDGALSYLASRTDAGARCVMFAGIRTVRETIVPVLERRMRHGVLSVSHRALIGLATEHFHAHDMGRFWGTPVATAWPHHVSWRVGARSFLRRSFHAQPFMIAAPTEGVLPDRSVDDDFVDRAYPDPASVEFVRDTDDFAVIEVSPRLHVLDHREGRLSMPLLAAWSGTHLNRRKRDNFLHAIRFRGDATAEDHWRRLETFSSRIANTLERYEAFHLAHAAVSEERPALAALLGRLLRDETAHRRFRIPSGPVTLLIPPELEIRSRLNADIKWLSAWIADHVLIGDHPLASLLAVGKVRSLSKRELAIKQEAQCRPMIGGIDILDADQWLGPFRAHILAET